MTEVEALMRIADAVAILATAIGGLVVATWLTVLFKSQSANSSTARIATAINRLANIIEEWIDRSDK